MSLGLFTRWAVERAVDLVNLFRENERVTRRQLQELLANYGYPEKDFRVGAFEQLAERLRHVAEAEDTAAFIERLNELLERFQPSPRIVDHDELGPHLHYVTRNLPPVDHIGASFAMAIANAVVDQGADRFGWCDAPSCERLFFDKSSNRSQRFCSKSCATRVHVAAHRARN
jgi:predicted RNA-binding Zn ribbon-like protein